MSGRHLPTVLDGDEILNEILEILSEINQLDEEISEQVDALMSESRSEPPEALLAFLSNLEEGSQVRETVQHLLHIKEDWDVLYTRIGQLAVKQDVAAGDWRAIAAHLHDAPGLPRRRNDPRHPAGPLHPRTPDSACHGIARQFERAKPLDPAAAKRS